MIIYISVENWLSFKDNILLDLSNSECALIYGDNKNNIFKILLIVKQLLLESEKISNNRKLPIQSFLFAKQNKPSKVEICFVYDGVKYLYGVQLNSDKIINEYLYYFENSRKIKIFVRKNTINFSFPRKYEEEMRSFIKLVWDNKLFLGILGHYKYGLVYNVYKFLTECLVFTSDIKIKYSKKFSQFMNNYFKLINYDILDYQVNKNVIKLEHKIENDIYLVDLDNENSSVRNLFYLLFFIYSSLGKVMFISDLLDDINPLVAGKILELIISSNSQILIGSNNLGVRDILKLDNKHVWMCEVQIKNRYNTIIYNIDDFTQRSAIN